MRWWRIRKRDSDLDREIQSDLELEEEEQRERGVSPEEARYAAKRAFGNAALIKDQTREAWGWMPAEHLWQDIRHALRRLGRTPGFAITVLLTLAVGIGANAAVFSVINRVLLHPLPYPESDRVVALWLNAPGAGGLASFSSGLQLSPSMYFTFLQQNQTFQDLGIWTPGMANVTGIARPERVRTASVSGGVLETFDVPAVVGRWFSAADQDPRGSKTVMLNYGYWQRRFGGDPSVIGRIVQVDSQPRAIVGVMPRNFRIADRDFDLLLPLALDPAHQKLAPFGYDGIGRLKPGISLPQADEI